MKKQWKIGLIIIIAILTVILFRKDWAHDSSMNGITYKESSNPLITRYHTLEVKDDIQTAVKDVFEKKSYPDGYETTVSPETHQMVLVIRPYSQAFFEGMKEDLKQSMEKVLTSKLPHYEAVVRPLYNETNHTAISKQQQAAVMKAIKEMEKKDELSISYGMTFSAAYGHIEKMTLMFSKNQKEIRDVSEINQYHKTFIDLLVQKDGKIDDFPINFNQGTKRDWEMKVIPSVTQGLKSKSNFPVQSVTLTENAPIIVNLSLAASQPKVKEKAEQIEKLVTEFFADKDVKKSFPGPQEVHVLDKDGKRIE
ncbi:hypothetical protein Q7A53_11260 [Halobacillus rhizosphaerae]|uniref:hypothetical protein n=1 Tax=Halobacillus rhizosphaerae TaxID=3064889 RepID=UPI00398B8528